MLCQSPFTSFDVQDCKKLYQFLDFCQQQSIADHHPKIASITLEIEAVDPLAILHQWVKPHQLHFYFEQRDQGTAIAAIDAVQLMQIEGNQRFSKAQNFIQNCFQHLISNRSLQSTWAAPRFFCNFTFFEQDIKEQSPFAPATVFLPRWQVVRWVDRSAVLFHQVIDADSDLPALTEAIWQEFQAFNLAQSGVFQLPVSFPSRLQWQVVDTHDFRATVMAALDSIQRQHLNKLVLAHAIDVLSPLPFQWGHSLHNLRQLHPDCYVFSTSNGQGQSFIGASPERLLSIQNRHLITDALAGSAARGRTIAEDHTLAKTLLNSDKERREHQVVVDFITQRLGQFGLRLHLADLPTLLQLSNIQHLHTPISTLLPREISPLEILAELHPTPAVAGMPRDTACEQIQQYEGFGRSLYAAPLGWVDGWGNAEFVVGIRSALLEKQRARLYAGAGIVAGSDPDRELAEVRLKLQTLLRALV